MGEVKYRLRVPLPQNVDRSFVPWPVKDLDGNQGLQLSHFDEHFHIRRHLDAGGQPDNSLEGIYARDAYSVAQSCLHQDIVFSGRFDILESFGAGHLMCHVDHCPFPREPWPSSNREYTSGQYLVDFVSYLAPRQVAWFYSLRPGDPDKWRIGNTRKPEWTKWKKNPRLDSIWFVAIRRTVPDSNGIVCYFPELEIRIE